MEASGQRIEVQQVPLAAIAEELRRTLPFADTNFDDFCDIGDVDVLTVPAGTELEETWAPGHVYAVILAGEVRWDRPEPDGTRTSVGVAKAGEGFGEAPILMGKTHSPMVIQAVTETRCVKFAEDDFWKLMAGSPTLRKVVLKDMALRLQSHQVDMLHRQKLVTLGTLAAGLMHELHNPGSAAKRASSQLRLNLLRLQQLSLRFSDQPKTPPQMECMRSLLEHTVRGCQMPAMSSIEQSDAEEAMAEWLGSAGVENAYTLAPALVGIGMDEHELGCAKDAFDVGTFSDALNWLEALVSSVTLVCTIEESITRVSDLVMAVKKFAYDEKAPARELDVHDSLQSTLTILGHKLRIKGIHVEKDFSANPASIFTRGSSLSQVWTNLIDNALDASPSNSKIRIATWIERGSESGSANGTGPKPDTLAVSIEDHGEGIPPEALPRIYEAFFTTKPQGSGTGLGLEIVHRIVTQKFGGSIEVKSEPGDTRFIVRLPIKTPIGQDVCLLPGR
jgi:signal transduction histidine kinase